MAGSVGWIYEGDARAQHVSSVLAGKLAAVHFRDGLDVEAIDVASLWTYPLHLGPTCVIGVHPSAPADISSPSAQASRPAGAMVRTSSPSVTLKAMRLPRLVGLHGRGSRALDGRRRTGRRRSSAVHQAGADQLGHDAGHGNADTVLREQSCSWRTPSAMGRETAVDWLPGCGPWE